MTVRCVLWCTHCTCTVTCRTYGTYETSVNVRQSLFQFPQNSECFINFGGRLSYPIVFQLVQRYINWGNILLCRQAAVRLGQQMSTGLTLASWQCADIVRAVQSAGGSADGK